MRAARIPPADVGLDLRDDELLNLLGAAAPDLDLLDRPLLARWRATAAGRRHARRRRDV